MVIRGRVARKAPGGNIRKFKVSLVFNSPISLAFRLDKLVC
jgi:hypothetical protein